MPASLASILGSASRALGQCAKRVEADADISGLSPSEYERLIGFGMACDWLRWAQHILSINYSKQKYQKSDRSYSILELTRFTYMWTATNALFARPAVIELLDSTRRSRGTELERFRILYNHSDFSFSKSEEMISTLHTLLSLSMEVQHFPWEAKNNPPTILEVIYFKHTAQKEKNNDFGQKLLNVIQTDNYASLDIPTLIYATRNWNIHGVLLSSSFRGTRKKFNLWIDTINFALANILNGSASALLNKLSA